ncbi:hypothetical protein GGS26DRAFT_95903 [Hypomontagnella submonticulosa]|nr:hypothetical protein GGS26DRAFT_95903 [Hypomontagnella submonticulosa]
MAEAPTSAKPRAFSPPNWLRTWRKHFNGQPWGFVIFRTARQGNDDDNDERRANIEEVIRRVIELPFARDVAQARKEGAVLPDDFHEARAKFEIRWVDDVSTDFNTPTTASDEDSLRVKYATLRPDLDPGLNWEVFFYASPEAVESFEKEAPTTDENSSLWRAQAPYLLAVTAAADSGLEEEHDEAPWFKPVFKVAAEVLVESLFDILNMGTPLQRITRHVKRATELDKKPEQAEQLQTEGLDDIWWSMHPSPERLRRRRKINSD